MPLLLPLLSWLLGSKLGRYVAIGVLVAASVGALALRIYLMGRNAEKAKQLQASLKALRERVKVDDEVQKLSPDKRLERLNRWVSDDQ